jgi:trigger factor
MEKRVNIQEKKLENSRMEITVEISADKVAEAYEKAFVNIQKNAKLDGFRKGKAPIAMIKSRFKEHADQEVVEIIVKDSYFTAVKDKNLHPISYPTFDFEKVVAGKGFTFKAAFDVPPSIALGDYKGISVSEKQCKVDDSDVNEEIEGMRQHHAVVSPKEEGLPTEKGDLVKLKVKRIDNVDPALVDATESREITVLAGSRNESHEFDMYVPGMEKEENKDVTFTYPADYQYPSVAGQTQTYRIEITDIQKRELPALDDEFAKKMGEYDSFDDLKQKTRERIEAFVSEKGRGEAKGEILKTIVENSKFDIPQSMIDEEKKMVLSRLSQRIGYRVDSVNELAPFFGMKPDELNSKLADEAVMSIKTSLAVAEISKKEEMTVTEEKFNEAVDEMAKKNGKTTDDIMKMIHENDARGRIESEIRYNNTVDFIYEQAKVKKEKPVSVKEFLKS